MILHNKIIITSTPKGSNSFFDIYERKVLIGSNVIYNKFTDYREPNDTDYLVFFNNKNSTKNTEYYYIPPLCDVIEKGQEYLTLNQLYTLKVSHSYWNIHWDKTMFDIKYLKDKGCEIDLDLHNKLYTFWEEKHGVKKVNLNQYTNDFFDDAVDRKYKHDDLHEMFKFYGEPLYKNLLITPDKPLMSKKKFFKLSKEDRIKVVQEETSVISFERFIIPEVTRNVKIAYMRALKILITSASKGWFTTFIVDNYKELSDIKKLNLKDIKNKL